MKNHITIALKKMKHERRLHDMFWLIMIVATAWLGVIAFPHQEEVMGWVVEDAPKYGTQEHQTMFANQYGESWQELY